jgi:Xaa-Pro aminopeptidase
MSAPADQVTVKPDTAMPSPADSSSDRRADVDAKQAQIASLLKEIDCEGLLVLEPENFAWLTSGGAARSALDASELPALYYSPEQRWVICGNVESQRLFDEEIDGLGFQVKEWQWTRGRDQLLGEICQGRKLACDRAFGNCQAVGESLRLLRRTLTAYERACLRSLGKVVGHALEATCRTIVAGQAERETAGQLAHRLLHRGAQPLVISVAADGRSRAYRQAGFTLVPIERSCVLSVTARKYGLCATASRTVVFGRPDEIFRQENDAACKICAAYVAATWPDAVVREILTAGRRVFQLTGFEHEWRACSPGHITGHSPVEMPLLPSAEDLLQAHWAVTWRASVGAAMSCDTILVAEEGPEIITVTEGWPLTRIRFQGAEFFRPHPLER